MKSLLAKLAGLSSAIFNFYAPILKSVFASGAAALLPIALEIVRSLADTNKTGAQKREAAVKLLTQTATKQGIDAAESVIRFTVESAVQKLKTQE
jgi:hypothetical protein